MMSSVNNYQQDIVQFSQRCWDAKINFDHGTGICLLPSPDLVHYCMADCYASTAELYFVDPRTWCAAERY